MTSAVTSALFELVVLSVSATLCFVGVISCPKKSKSECIARRLRRLFLSELPSVVLGLGRRLCCIGVANVFAASDAAADTVFFGRTAESRHAGISSSAFSKMRNSVRGKELA